MRIGTLSRLWPTRRRREADTCLRCRTSYVFSKAHGTIVESPVLPNVRVVAPLCKACWRELTPETRLPYYRRLWLGNRGENPRENELVWAAIEFSVKAGA